MLEVHGAARGCPVVSPYEVLVSCLLHAGQGTARGEHDAPQGCSVVASGPLQGQQLLAETNQGQGVGRKRLVEGDGDISCPLVCWWM